MAHINTFLVEGCRQRNKDVEGSEWTLGEVKTDLETESGYVHLLYCSSDGRLKVDREGTTSATIDIIYAATLANFLCTQDHDWCRT